MGRRFVTILTVVVLVLTTLQFTSEQTSAQVADFLRQITARITVSNTGTGREGLCHGFVGIVRGEAAFVATAKHCIEELASGSLRPDVSLRDLGLSVTMQFANGTTGNVLHWFASGGQDVTVLVSSFGERPDSYAGLCPTCRTYQAFGVGQRIPIESILSAGGGAPVVSSGFVASDQFGRYRIFLPSSPGTSGSPIVDLRGNLVGIVSTVATFGGAEAGWIAGIALGSVVDAVTRYALEHYQP